MINTIKMRSAVSLRSHMIRQGNLPDPGIEPTSPVSSAVAGRFFTTEPPGKPIKRLLLIEENQTSKVNEFSVSLCMGTCKILDSLK